MWGTYVIYIRVWKAALKSTEEELRHLDSHDSLATKIFVILGRSFNFPLKQFLPSSIRNFNEKFNE